MWESIRLLLNNVITAAFWQLKHTARTPLFTLFTNCIQKAIFLLANFPIFLYFSLLWLNKIWTWWIATSLKQQSHFLWGWKVCGNRIRESSLVEAGRMWVPHAKEGESDGLGLAEDLIKLALPCAFSPLLGINFWISSRCPYLMTIKAETFPGGHNCFGTIKLAVSG